MSDVPSLFHLSATATPVAVFTRPTQKLIFLVLIATVILAAGLFVVDYAFENLMKFIYTL